MFKFEPFQHLYQDIKLRDQRLFECLNLISLNLKNIFVDLAAISAPTDSANAITGPFAEYLMIADRTITASLTTGDKLTIAVTQDSSGFWKLTMSTGFRFTGIINLNPNPGKTTIFDFICRGDGLLWPTHAPYMEP